MYVFCSVALADVVWPKGEEPNVFVQWWINRATRNAALWPSIITICVATIGLTVFFIRLRRYRRNMKRRENGREALTRA
jgi:hypothetical protein